MSLIMTRVARFYRLITQLLELLLYQRNQLLCLTIPIVGSLVARTSWLSARCMWLQRAVCLQHWKAVNSRMSSMKSGVSSSAWSWCECLNNCNFESNKLLLLRILSKNNKPWCVLAIKSRESSKQNIICKFEIVSYIWPSRLTIVAMASCEALELLEVPCLATQQLHATQTVNAIHGTGTSCGSTAYGSCWSMATGIRSLGSNWFPRLLPQELLGPAVCGAVQPTATPHTGTAGGLVYISTNRLGHWRLSRNRDQT